MKLLLVVALLLPIGTWAEDVAPCTPAQDAQFKSLDKKLSEAHHGGFSWNVAQRECKQFEKAVGWITCQSGDILFDGPYFKESCEHFSQK